MEGNKRQGWPLAWVVSAVIIFSTLLVSLVLVGKSYFNTRDLIVQASSESAIQLAATLDSEMVRLVKPLDSTLRILSQDPLTRASDLSQRNQRLRALAEALKANPILSSIYIGYPDGSFYLLRSLVDEKVADSLKAPAGSAYLVQSIERSEGASLKANWQYYSSQLTMLQAQRKDDYRYDPRVRPWFKKALQQSGETILTSPYIFFTTHEIGISMALRDPLSGAILGLDASVNALSVYLQKLKLTPGSELAITNGQGTLVAYPDTQQLIHSDAAGELQLSSLDSISSPVLSHFYNQDIAAKTMVKMELAEDNWYALWVPLISYQGNDLRLLTAFPAAELLASARASLWNEMLWSGVLIILLVLISLAMGQRIFSPFQRLSEDIAGFAAFDFRQPVQPKSYIREINHLSGLMSRMASTILHFQQISRSLAYEKNLDKMLDDITHHLAASSRAVNSLIYLHDPEHGQLNLATRWGKNNIPQCLDCPDASVKAQQQVVKALLDEDEPRLILMPLLNRQGQALGILALELPAELPTSELPNRQFIKQLSGAAAAAIETRHQVEAQRQLIDGMIQLLADAIDAKSPYTSGHCERVPQLAEMLIDEVQGSEWEPFRDFTMNELEREEFRIAAWMHDCGKITSPEYVVDKATKLETIYNRIHEIRTRFEVLWRDAEIGYLTGLLDQQDEAQLAAQRDTLQAELAEDFALIAKTNIGGEFLDDEVIERLQRIGERTWQRHFAKRLGLSTEELKRMAETVDSQLPMTEKLLDDQPWHRIPWDGRRPPVEADDPANIWGFNMTLPEYSYDLGELHNLSIRRGTLTDEERFKINDHIVQTIIMLSTLPLPPALQRVPDIAGNHHEKMDGSGYPRRLPGENLSVAEKVMAIADIFEALTAADRPYKTAKTLSESLWIMAFMVQDRHVDADLFRLFLESGIYLTYAQRFLKPEQLDAVDIKELMGMVNP